MSRGSRNECFHLTLTRSERNECHDYGMGNRKSCSERREWVRTKSSVLVAFEVPSCANSKSLIFRRSQQPLPETI